MQFDSINAFFDMGGYGFYVWLSYGVTAVSIILLIVLSKQKHKKTIQHISLRYKREIKRKEAAIAQAQKSSLESIEEKNESTP